MCGIFFSNSYDGETINRFDSLSYRGPDGSQILIKGGNLYGFHRLSIINPLAGINQPFQLNNIIVLANGEIYNWQELAHQYDIQVQSDCEIIGHLYLKLNCDFTKLVQSLDGEFAIILHDLDQGVVYSARDFMGIRPLYYSYENGQLELASELKALTDKAHHILPRQIYKFTKKSVEMKSYWEFPDVGIKTLIQFAQQTDIKSALDNIYDDLYDLLFKSVEMRTHADRPIACLLSGGLDSSLITALVAKVCPHVQCFVIGTKNSPDVIAAQKVADFLQVPLQIVPFYFEEAIESIPDVIRSIETYDITTIRASTPQWHLARWISKNTDIKVVLSGEGSDEIFNGYAYTKLYDDSWELWREGERLLSELYLFDCLRTDRTLASAGLEVRVPFLQKDFIEYVRKLDPELLMYSKKKYHGLDRSIEKVLLRNMAAKYSLLPSEIIWRPKEAFSDAVGFSWKDAIGEYVNKYCDETNNIRYDHLLPISKEADWYRKIFDNTFPGQAHILPHYWMPKKCENITDPSARVLPTYHTALALKQLNNANP